ncbi:MAG TPA: ATP-binding protein [Puia sp.]|nr:ATP-binding protein [Puia sp.]
MITRDAENVLRKLATQFKAIALTGPRQSGKSTLAKTAFPEKKYISLENPDIRESALNDTRGFLHNFPNGAIIDEAQRVPELFSYLQQVLDESDAKGLFILTGSNNFLMLENISQSLAGRIGYLELLPFSYSEIQKIPGQELNLNQMIFSGGYPSITFDGIAPEFWFPSYIRTYIERDVRQIKNITNLNLFQKLLYLCAGRTGQQLNLNNLAIECGVDHKTIGAWIGILQASYVIHLLPPFYNNFSKRIIKSPKLYFYDTGLACALLGINSPAQLNIHSSRGALFENYIINEFIKTRFNKGRRSNLFYWRDVSGHEIDIVVDHGSYATGIELKSGMTVVPDFFKGLTFWQSLTKYEKCYVIYGGEDNQIRSNGIEVIPWNKKDIFDNIV